MEKKSHIIENLWSNNSHFFPITRHSNFICHDLTMQMKGHLYEVHLLLWQKKKKKIGGG